MSLLGAGWLSLLVWPSEADYNNDLKGDVEVK